MNLKESLKKIVKNKKPDTLVLNAVTNTKNKAAQEKSYALYDDLRQIEHSLYRYNSLLNSNMLTEAEQEGNVLLELAEEADNITLKGGISTTKFIWKTEPNACEKCQELDGTEYTNKDDIPEKPHPNCKCKVTEVPADDEMCDCNEYFQELDNISEKVETAHNEASGIENFIKQMLTIYATPSLSSIGTAICDEIINAQNAYRDFVKNKEEMAALKGYDKYYHAKANCEAFRRGATGEAVAYTVSIGKEVVDMYKKVFERKMNFQEAWTDSIEDLGADIYGMSQKNSPWSCGDSVKNVGDIFNIPH